MTRVFVDANILFSASYTPGRKLSQLWQLEDVTLVVVPYIIAEVIRNLVSVEQRLHMDELVSKCSVELHPGADESLYRDHHGLPVKDRPIMWAAIDLGCDYLVTGDKLHFGALIGKMVEGVRVVRAEDIFREFGDQCSPESKG